MHTHTQALVLTIVTLIGIAIVSHVEAQVMQSGSYQIQSDSINVGGLLSSSTNYRLEDTVGEVGTGESTSSSFNLRAGYQQMQEIYLSLTGAANVTLASISGLTGGNSIGSTTVTATTDNIAGYLIQISASSSPALVSGGDTIADYVPVGIPDFNFTTGATDSHFGFSPEGVDIATPFKDNGSACNEVAGGDTALRCWDGLSTSPATIVNRTSSNHPSGSTTTIQFQVGIGGSVNQAPGTYVATTTLTMLPL